MNSPQRFETRSVCSELLRLNDKVRIVSERI